MPLTEKEQFRENVCEQKSETPKKKGTSLCETSFFPLIQLYTTAADAPWENPLLSNVWMTHCGRCLPHPLPASTSAA